MKVAGFIPSRLNSERVPQKNIKELGGIPLINYSLRVLNKVKGIDEAVVFASEPSICDHIEDDLEYTYLKRPASLDTAQTTIQDIISEFLKLNDADIIVLLHVTSPFLKPETVSECLAKVLSGEYDSAFTAYSFKKFAWFKGKPLNYSLDKPTPRTQDIEPIITEQSSLYVFKRDFFLKTKRRIGNKPYIRSIDHFEGHDIDTPEDFEIAELIVNAGFFSHLK
ncbi:MAG: acylneuraminate cytidylyltransferase family protein [Candidatus Saganbacteria bacterium]|nr:acylneuraminate cytidylyltransferase family protein [Candidatus Saganbacteria bacterium]